MELSTVKKHRWPFVTARDVKVAIYVLLFTVTACSFYVNSCERGWKRKWMKLASQKDQILKDCVILEMGKNREGNLFETFSIQGFIESVSACTNNSVNNVYYAGSLNGYDYFVHNSDFLTCRIKVNVGNLNTFPFTKDVSRWLPVATIPTRAASDLAEFLNGGKKRNVEEN